MSIYKIIAFILIFIIIASSIGGVLFMQFDGNSTSEVKTLTTSKSDINSTFEFETLELALNEKEREIGYMNRESICAKCGMLFVFENQQPLSFWMKNTLIPLKITFIDQAGRVINSEIGQPKVTNPSINSLRPAKYVLEVPIDSPMDFKPDQEVDIQTLIGKGIKHSTVENGGNFK
jgi:uncharacterized membrane protein (UPF0127 family)